MQMFASIHLGLFNMKTKKNIKERKKERKKKVVMLLLLFTCSAKYEIDGHPSGRPPMHTRTLSHVTYRL
jgi:hypothetical protein